MSWVHRCVLSALTLAALVPAVPPARADAQDGAITYVATTGWSVPFTVWTPMFGPDGAVKSISAGGGPSRRLLRHGSAPAYSPGGDRIAYGYLDGHVFVARADGSGMRQLVPDPDLEHSEDAPTWAPDGSRIAVATDEGLEVATLRGRSWSRLTRNKTDREPTWGPDGRIAFARLAGGLWRVFVMNGDGSGVRQLTSGATSDTDPAWSPDGSTIAFEAESADRIDLYTVRADGTGLSRLTLAGPDEANREPAWSADGSRLAYTSWGPFGNDSELMTFDLRTGAQTQLTANATDEASPTWNPVARAAVAAKRPSPLSRRRRPSAGVNTFMKIVHGGAGGPEDCLAGYPSDPPWLRGPMIAFAYRGPGEWVYHGGRTEIGTSSLFCLFRFARRPRPRFEVTSSTGRVLPAPVIRGALGSGARWGADWASLPGQEGDYVARATQAGRTVTTTFRIVPAERPHLLVLGRDFSPDPVQRVGRDVRAVVAGLAPNTRFVVDLYADLRGRSDSSTSRFQYFNSISRRTGADGARVIRIPTSPRVRPGAYWMVLRLGRRTRDMGCVTMQRRVRPAVCWAVGENPHPYGR
jgi:hypothetical protein